ncbi:uncharacterized protein [Henckelia pumila]|uniref:uncharacterized protein isoform X2 n=1 Tax=Henckelia pumila TaxID=405737 RepID=UPI003C6E10BB
MIHVIITTKDSMLDPKDLRLKLTCKRISRRMELEIEKRKMAGRREKVPRAVRALESPERSLLTKIPSSSGAAEPPAMDSISSSYTSRATNGARSNSPERFAKYSGGFPIPRYAVDQLPYVSSNRHMDASRTAQFSIGDPLECSAEGSFLTNIPLSRGAAEPPQMDPVGSYTSRATSGERPQSSDRVATYLNMFSTPRTAVDQLPHVPYASRTAQFLIRDSLECSAEGSFLTNSPLSRGAAEPPQMDPVSGYTSWATSGERPQSSDRVATYYNGVSTPRTAADQLPHVPYASRTAQFLIRDPLECSAERSFLTNSPLSRGAAEPPLMDPVSIHTSWATNGEGPQSSSRVAKYFNGFPTPRTAVDQLSRVPSIRHMEASRTGQFLISEPLESPKFPSPTMSVAHADFGKLVMELPPVTGGMFEAPPFTDILPPTVSCFLHSLGLGKYAINFQAEEIDMVALKQMGELDLRELGIPMGPRKKILSALHSRTMPPLNQTFPSHDRPMM